MDPKHIGKLSNHTESWIRFDFFFFFELLYFNTE